MKRFTAVFLALIISVCVMSTTAYAGREGWEYASGWSGDEVTEVTDMHGVTYLVMKEPGTAYFDFHIKPDDKVFYLIVWAGNYKGRGACSFTLDCLDEEKNTVASFGSTQIPDDGSFYRTELGYAPDGITAAIPEDTAVMRLSINFESGKNSPYFDVSASFNDYGANVAPEAGWSDPKKQSQVGVETTAFGFWLSIGFVCAVAAIMMIVAKVRKKYTKGRLK